MSHRWPRRILSGLNLFLGLTAVAGGISLVFGWISMPTGLLAGSSFTDYTVPGLLLALVGAGALTASRLVYTFLDAGLISSVVIGGAITIFEIVEWSTIGFTPLQAFYIGVGVAIFATVAWIKMTDLPIPLRARHSGLARH